MLKEGNIYVSKDKELRIKIIWLYYNILIAGHRGKWKIIELMM